MVDGHGPATSEAEKDPKPRTKPAPMKNAPKPLSSVDRYATLQRKLEDLERVHADGKKSHQLELERLKAELSRSRLTIADQASSLEKLKKTNDTLDTRLSDLKKSAAADQAEVKDLKVKLRMVEHEKAQLVAKQGDAGDAKKALAAAETRRREETREKDKKIAELEKALTGERKKREGADAKLKEMKTKSDEEIKEMKTRADEEAREAREAAKGLQAQVEHAKREAREAKSALAARGEETDDKESLLLAQLEQHRATISRVAEEYGALASATVPASAHAALKLSHAGLQMRVGRAERKRADADAQVVELAHLIRQTTDGNKMLAAHLRDATDAAAFYARELEAVVSYARPTMVVDADLEDDVAALGTSIADDQRRAREAAHDEADAALAFYRTGCAHLVALHADADRALTEQHHIAQHQTAELSAAITARDDLAAQLDTARLDHLSARKLLVSASATAAEAQGENAVAKARIAALETQMQEAAAKHAEALRVEKQIVQRTSAAAQVVKMSEAGLKAEVEQLTTELTDAEHYQEAYHTLVEEVGQLMDRNDLAEGEAERLSAFNAEILGHRNPAQRIMYVDRIRRELAETKQQLLMLTRDHDAIAAANDELQHELGMYTSVAVHGEKPRTHITRVERPAAVPLASQNLNVVSDKGTNTNGGSGGDLKVSRASSLESIPGDMTLDELV